MDSYSRKEFETMQQEAIRRVKEMQKRAQSYVTVPPENNTTFEEPKNINSSQNNRNRQNNFNHNRNFSNNNRNNFNNQKLNQSRQNSHNNNQPQMHSGNRPNGQQMSMGNPFSQLFGSNLGGFAKFKNMLKPLGSLQSNLDDTDCDNSNKPLNGLLNGVLKDFDIDEEKIILGILIYLLYKNGSDAKLLLALGYLIL